MTFQKPEPSGQMFGQRYKILRQLREEPWGEVWLAQDLFLNAEVGLKALTREDPEWARGQQIFEQEAALALRLRHPLILGVYHLDRTEAAVLLVEEPFAGESLLGHLSRPQRFSLPQALQILTQISEALAFAQQLGVVHQSLNPLQVLITAAEVRLANFTCPRPDRDQAMYLELWAYDPPEVLHGDPLTPAGNVFSLGVLGFRLLAGSLPYPLTFDEPFPYRLEIPRADLDEIPAVLQNLLLRALAEEPEERFPHADAFLAQLRQAREFKSAPARVSAGSWQPEVSRMARKGLNHAGAFLENFWQKIEPPARKIREKASNFGSALQAAPRGLWWGLGLAALVVVALTVAGKMGPRTATLARPPAALAPITLPPVGGGPPLVESGEPAAAREAMKPGPTPAAAGAAGETARTAKEERYLLVVATYSSQKQAQALVQKLKARNLRAKSVASKGGGKTLYQVQVGPIAGAPAAEETARSIKTQEKITPKVMKVANRANKTATSRRQAR
jgi:serine/threonine-protein kinase